MVLNVKVPVGAFNHKPGESPSHSRGLLFVIVKLQTRVSSSKHQHLPTTVSSVTFELGVALDDVADQVYLGVDVQEEAILGVLHQSELGPIRGQYLPSSANHRPVLPGPGCPPPSDW